MSSFTENIKSKLLTSLTAEIDIQYRIFRLMLKFYSHLGIQFKNYICHLLRHTFIFQYYL